MALQSGLDRFRVHGFAVVEADALAQLDGDGFAVLGGLVRQRQLRHDVEPLVDVEELVAERRKCDAADVGTRQRRIEHVGILGQTNAQRGLGHGRRRADEQNGGNRRTDKTKPLHETALPSWRDTARFKPCTLASNARIYAAGWPRTGPAADAGGNEETMSRHRWQAVACASPAAKSKVAGVRKRLVHGRNAGGDGSRAEG